MPASRPARKKPVRTARQSRSRATVEVILEAGARILSQSGWAGLTTNAVAARAGVSVGSLYEYFADKQAIVDALLDRHLDEAELALARAAAGADGHAGPQDIAVALVAGYAAVHAGDPGLHRALSSQVPIGPSQLARLKAIKGRAVALVAGALEGHVADAPTVGRVLVDAADTLTHHWIAEEAAEPHRLAALLDSLAAMLAAFVRVRSRPAVP